MLELLEVSVLFMAIGAALGVAMGMSYDMTVMEEIRNSNPAAKPKEGA